MSTLVDQLGQIVLGEYIGICVGATMYFDYILTIPQEVELIWMDEWTAGKALFLVVRYFSLLSMSIGFYVICGTSVTTFSCKVTMYWTLSSNCISYSAAALVLALRTWALWNKSRACGILLGTAWVAATVGAVVCTVYSILELSPFGNVLGLPGCVATVTPSASASVVKAYAFSAAYEGFIFLLTVARGIYHLSNPTGLIYVLYRDAFVGSAILFSLAIANTVLSRQGSSSFYPCFLIGLGFFMNVPCRIMLNVRAMRKEVDGWTRGASYTTE
ncbi:hypothetical protein CALCODRAFT_285958 [Calocera cornea HHB12733]|uniref:DUF6533 domain-containing protein n=1 Tax=Calocera cornea HHB12733 TaxID=1353952 RepID=A0A165FWR6_9BASI|nr:hypothetical protein CALCODRAFT_285958 [Calocera cornea HHB12733]